MKKIYQDCGGADEDMGQQRGVDFSKVTREKTVLRQSVSIGLSVPTLD